MTPRKPSRRTKRSFARSSTIAIAEVLEVRQLLAAGDFDATFSGDGRLTGPGSIQDAEVIVGGKIVTVGFADSVPVVRRFNADGTADTSFGAGTGRVVSPIIAHTVE